MMTNESPLARAEAAKYVEQQKSADFNRNMAQYMFWGATSLLLPVLGVAFSMVAAPAALGYLGTLALGGVVSAGTFIGSVFFSRKATEISEQSNVLYSDVDSQNQARRMVQAFARAQAPTAAASPSRDETPMTAAAVVPTADANRGSWADRVGSSASRTAESWQSRVIDQADREDAQALQNLR